MTQKPALTLLATACALAVPALAHSRQVTLNVQLKDYGGNGAYLAAYLTDAKRLDGVTGASVGSGRTLKVTADLADALIDAGYEIRIDAAVEDMRDSPAEVRVPLSAASAGKPQAGKQYIQSATLQLQ